MSWWNEGEVGEAQAHVERFVREVLVPRAPCWDRARIVDQQSWALAADAGILCTGIPVEYGGAGGSMAHELMIQQELARAGLAGSFGICHSIHSIIVANYILAYASEELKARWLPAMARGELIGAIAMTEPGTGSDLQSIAMRAVRAEGGWRLNGQKTFISNGQSANLIIVVARTSDGRGSSSLSLLGVETQGCEGFSRGRNLEKLGLHGQDTSELFFEDVFVGGDCLLGNEPGHGFKQLMHQLALERMIIALNAVVNLERALELTVEYVRQRRAFGRALLDFQNTQFVLAGVRSQALVAREFVDALMMRLLSGSLDAADAAAAKLWATETSFRQIDACQQLFGGYGYMAEYPIARLFADSRVARVYGGTSEIMKRVIAQNL